MADEVLNFDDLPSFDDMPDAAGSQNRENAQLRFDDIPDFDDIPASDTGRPAPETATRTALREAAHATVPAGAGLVGAGLGGAAAGALGAGPVGAFVGGLAGMVAASYGAGAAQEAALNAAGFDDSEQRAANRAENPKSAFAGTLAPAVVTMSPQVAARATGNALSPAVQKFVGSGNLTEQAIQRGAGGVMMGAFEAGQEYLNEGHIDPTTVAAATGLGAVAPSVNRVGQRFVGAGERLVPGRPNRTANPAADQAHADVQDATADVEVGNSSLAQSPHVATGETTGNPQSAPERSSRAYGKDTQQVSPAQDMLTQGQTDPATAVAIEGATPKPAAATQQDAPAPAPAVQGAQPPADGFVSPNAQKPRLSIKRPAAPEEGQVAGEPAPSFAREPVVEAGIPQPGEPVAMGANDATPLPPGTPERAAKAIARSKSQQKAEQIMSDLQEPSRPVEKMPELKGETPINDSITEAQKAAGNYPKARSHDFGKPQKIETHAGDVRRGKGPDGTDWEVKLPYDYGYFNKTKGADKDHIDFARPKPDAPEAGDKFFVIDQKNADTGKFDEHKLFTYYKDEAAARKHYEAGFSDGRGGERLGAITEVDRPGLVKFLQKHTGKAATKPFSPEFKAASPIGQKKDVRERAVYQDLVAKKPEMAEALKNAPDEAIEKAIAGKRVRKYGVGTGASAGYPVEGVFNADGRPVTANTKAKAAERSAAHKKVADWFERSAPKSETETRDDLMKRLLKDAPNIEGWKPTHKPREWMLAREAQRFLQKPTPGNEKKFREAERLLRGAPEDVEAYRGGNRVEADIARSRRSGDEAVASAEAKNVDLGRNTAEDEMIAAIDAKRGGKFDVPHEEAEAMVKPEPVKTKADLKQLPRKTVDVNDSSLAKIDTKAISKEALRRAEEAKALVGKKSEKAAGTESEGAASQVRKIQISDPAEMARIMEAMNKATSKTQGLDALPAERIAKPKGIQDLLGRFVADEEGALHPQQIAQDVKRWMSGAAAGAFKKTHQPSYRAMKLKTDEDFAAQEISDRLQGLKKDVETAGVNTLKFLERIPKPDRNHKIMSEIYHAREADSAHFPLPAGKTGTHLDNLSPQAKRVYETYLQNEFDHVSDIVKDIRNIAPDRIGPDVSNHISRLTKQEMAEYNLLKQDDDPTNPGYHSLKVNADQAKNRRFYALVGADGRRHVIGLSDTGFTVWNRYKAERVKVPDFEFVDGETFQAGPNSYTMRQATTKEIEANALGPDRKPMKYYDNAAFSAAVAKSNLSTMAKNIIDLHYITQTPEFKRFTTTNYAEANKNGWQKTDFPNLSEMYMSPQLKAVFDDFAGMPPSTWGRLNSLVTKSIFWLPVAHIRNVAEHMIVGRGWDNFNPIANWRLLTDIGPKAIKSVLQQDGLQSELRHEGAGLIYGSVKTRRLTEQIAKRLGLEIQQNPGKWGPVADKLGLSIKQLGNAIWDTSSHAMWSAGDMLLTMRIMELQRKGLTRKQAIIEAERDIPNYRVPHQSIGRGSMGRTWSKLSQNSQLVAFGRYHHGMFNSYANIIKDAVGKDATLGDRLDAVGKMMTMAAIAFMVYPAVNFVARAVTGNEHAHVAPRGPMSVPEHMGKGLRGESDASQWIRGSVTPAPLANLVMTWIQGKDFRGKNILEPGDLRAASEGNPKAAARVVGAGFEHTARNVFSPYGTFANAMQKRNPNDPGDTAPKAVGKALRDAVMDVKDPSDRAIRYKKMVPIKAEREARTRFKHGGSGPIEGLIGKTTGYR